MGNKTIKHLDESFTPLTDTLGLEGVSENEAAEMRAAYLAKEIKVNPDFECWDYINYHKTGSGEVLRDKGILVSNRGRICVSWRSRYKIYTGFINGRKNRCRRAKIKIKNGYFDLTVSRAVACLFVPLPNDRTYKDSFVKFKKGDQPLAINLVWCTIGTRYCENMEHVIGIVKVAGDWNGYRFALTDLVSSKCGVSIKKVRESIRNGTHYKWCKWQVVTEKTWNKYKVPFPEELSPLLSMNEITKKWLESTFKATFNQDHRRPVTLLFKPDELEKFNLRLDRVKVAVSGGTVYRGLRWSIATKDDIKEHSDMTLVERLSLMEEIKARILRLGGSTRPFNIEWLRRKTQPNQLRG